MHANSKSFLMAIVVGTTTLVLAQIYAPNHLKPLTNRLITYPGSIPALNLKNGIFQTTFTPAKLISELSLRTKNTINSYMPQVGTIAMIREDQVGTSVKVVKPSTKPATVTPKPIPKDERDDIKPSTKPSTKPPSPTPLAPFGYGNNQPSPITSPSKAPSPSPVKSPTPTSSKAPTPSIKPSPTPTAQEILDKARQDAYTSTYGTEAGRYGYNYTTGKPATTAEWNDPKAVIAGTYVAPNGKRYSVNIDTTNAAGNDLMNKVSSSIVNLSDQEILDLAKSRNQTNPCSANDKACQQKIIEATLAQIAKESFIGNVSQEKISAITDAQHKNSVFQTQIKNFMDPSKSLNDLAGCTTHPGECRGLTLEDYLKDIGVDPKDIPGLLKSREDAAKFQTQIKNFMDPTKSLNDLAGCTAHPGECRGLTAEQYLHDIGVDPKDIPALLEGRQANLTAVAKAKQVQQTQINTVNKFLTKSEAELKKEYCPPGTSPDRCESLMNGGLLTAVGISPEDAKKFVTQKQAAITISQYETGNLSIVAGKPVDYQAAYKTAYTACMAISQGRDKNCETKATAEADKKVAKLTTPVDYQAKYDQGYSTCLTNSQGRGSYSYGDCQKYATNFAQTAVTNSTTGAINVPKVEVANLTASCIALGGKNCGTSEAALTSLAAMTGNPELTLATIQSQKLQIQQEQKAYSNVYGTLTNLGKAEDVAKAVSEGRTTWIEVQNNINALREDGWTNAVIGWNDFTAGRFKRGNDLLMEGEREGDVAKILKGSLIQGGDAAMVITAAAAIPLAPALGLGAGAFFGTGVGVAASTQMIGSATDTCELANQGKATKADCNKAIAMASISVVGTGLGVVGEATKLVQAGEQVSSITKAVGTFSQGATASKIISGVEVANDVVSAGTFTAMAKDTCDAAGPESLDCISSVAMAIASGGKLVTNGVNVITKAANVEQSMGGVSQFSNAALQGAHTASADLFFLSACSKMLDPEIAKTSDSVAMCAFGLSGAVQTHVIANLSPAGKPPELSTEKTPVSDVTLTPKDLAEYNASKSKVAEAQAAVEKLAKTVELTSGSVQKDVIIQLNEAKTHLSTMEQAHTEVVAKINAESVAATAALAKAKAEVESWQKTVDNLSGQTQKDAIVQLNDAKIALSLAETANKIAMAKAATVNPQAQAPAAPPAAPPPPTNNQGDGAKPQGLIAKVGEFLFGKESAPLQVADRKIILNEEFKGLVEKLGEIKANRGESALSGKDPVLVAETRTVDGKEVTQFKFNEKVTERSGMTEAELGKLNQVFSDYQAFSDKNIGFDATKGIRGQQADYLMAGLEAFAQHGSTGSLFGALPGLGKTEVILPMMTYLHASMTSDPQFVLFPEVKLMRPWLSIDASGKSVKNAEIIAFFEAKFGEGSVLILEPGQVPTAAEVGKARVVVATRDAAFELQSIDTLGGRALREKWANSYKFVDESHWTTNLFENFRRSGVSNKISEIAEANVFKSALESVRKFTSINELVEARKSGTPLDVKLTSDGKTGEYTVEREVKIITELLEKNQSILPDHLKNLEINERNLAESKKLIDQFVDQNFSQPKVKNFAAELTTINKLADLLAAVPGTHYGLTQKGGEYSIAPREQSRSTGRAYSNLAEQILYNEVGVEILKGVGEMKSSINVNVDNLTVSTGGSETTYARLMLEGKGFAMFTGTPELMAKLYKIAYGIELKVFSASAFETVSTRFASGDNNGIFTSIKEQVKSRIKEFNQGKSQVYTFMDGKTSNVEMTEKLLTNYKEGDKVFIVKASGELVEGKVTGGKFELVKTLDSAEALGRAQEAAGKYVKIYEFGAHTGVDTPNNVDLSRAIGICNGCDQTTFSQGINRVRLDANGNAAPMDIIVLDQSLRSTPKDKLFEEFTKLTADNEAHNLTVAEVNFKEILLKTSVDIAFERMLAKSGDGVLGAIRDGGLKAKLEAIQSSWKSISEYNYKLDNANFTPEQKLARTLEQVQGVMKSVDAAIGNNRSVRAEFESAVGKYSELSIKFNETESFKPLGDKPSLGDVVELINNTSADLKTTTVTFREKGASGETIAVAGQEAVRNLESGKAPTLLERTQNLIKSVTTPVIVPRSLALLTASKTFKSFSTEDEDGNILRIFKDSAGKLMFEESNQDVGMSSSREFNMTDLDLFPPASQTVATRYNDKLIPTSDYSRNAIKPGKDNAEELQKIIDSEGFSKMSIALASGDTITIEIIGGDPVVNTKTADGKAYSESPSSEQLSEILADLADQVVAISRNGEDVPLMTYLTLPNEKQPILVTLANFFNSPNSEKAGGITIDSSKINLPSAASFQSLGSAIANALRDLSENYLLAQVQPIEQKPATPEESKPVDLAPNVVETKVVETKTTTEHKAINSNIVEIPISASSINSKNGNLIFYVIGGKRPDASTTELKNKHDYPIAIVHNGIKVVIEKYKTIDIKAGDVIEYGYQTIKYMGINSNAGELTADLEVTTLAAPFNEKSELASIETGLSNAKDSDEFMRGLNLRHNKFLAILTDRYSKLQALYNNIIATINKYPTMSAAELHKQVFDLTISMQLTDNEITNIQKALRDYLQKRDKVVELLKLYEKPEDLFEAAFGSRPTGTVEMHQTPYTIEFITTNDVDFALVYHRNEVLTGKTNGLTEKQINEAKKYAGLQIISSTRLPDTGGIFTVNKTDSDPEETERTIIHEREHAFYEQLSLALGIKKETASELSARESGYKELELLSSSVASDIKKSLMYRLQFNGKSVFPNARINIENKLKAIKSAAGKVAFIQRRDAENDVANELIARISETVYKAQNIKGVVSNVAFKTNLLNYITEKSKRGSTKNNASTATKGGKYDYDFFAQGLSKNLHMTSFNKNWAENEDNPEANTIRNEFKRIFSNEQQELVADKAIEAYKTMILKGYTHDEAVALLSTTRLAYWGNVARRVPIAQPDQVIQEENLVKSGSSIGNRVKDFFNKMFKSPTRTEPVTDEEVNVKPPENSPTSINDTPVENKTFEEFMADSQSNLPETIRVKPGDLNLTMTRLLTSGPNLLYWRNLFIESQNIRAKYGANFISFHENGDLNEANTLKFFRNRLAAIGYKIVENSPRIKEVAERRNFDPEHINAVQNSGEKTLHLRRKLSETSLSTLIHEYIHIMQGLSISDKAVREHEAYVGSIMFMELDRADGQDSKEYLENLINKTVNYTEQGTSNQDTNQQSQTMKETEQKYISDKLEKFPLLDERYADESTSFDGYTADMNKYIGKSNVKAAPKGNISKDGLDKVKSNVQAEITRLLKNKKYRNNQEKYDIVTWQTNRFVDLLKQAIDEGDIKTDGDNVLTLQAAQDLILRNIHTLAYQDFVASENTLGDHGVRHLVDHNIRVGEKVLDLAKTKDTHTNKSEAIRAIDYLILHQVMIDHDTGYAMNVVRTAVNLDATKGYDSGHNVLAAKMIRERTESGTDPLSQLFGKDGVARIHQGVINHDSSAVDITVDRATSVDSAIHLADNTHAFETKLPELLYGYPDSIVAMRLLKAAGEIGDEKLMKEIKLQLINNIQNNSNIGIDDKIALTNAVRTLTKNSYSYTVGRIMGHNPQITFDDTTGKIVISVTESEIHQQVVGLFNRDAYDQLAKFIADLLGIKKAEAIARIQNNDLKFDGKNVVIQANVIDQNNPTRIVTKNTDFQDRVRDLTANNPAFVEYLSKDDNLKDLAKSKEEEIQAKSAQGLEKPFLDELQRQLEELKRARSDAAQAYLISQNNIDLNKAPTLLDRLKDLFKKAPKIAVIPVAHDTKQLAINESAYLNRFAPKMKNLQVRYDHVNSSELGYTSSMNRYIGTYKIKSPGSAPLTTKGLEKVRSNVKSEITRLFNNKNRRQNPLKFREVSWEVNRYLDLIAQAIKDGDIKTDGSNGLTLEDIQSIVVRNIHTLAYQDFVAAENTLGDHGVRHLILHNIHVGEKVLDLSVENKTNADPVRAIDYLMLHQVMIDHDMGYAVDIVRMGVNRDSTLGADSGHNVLAAKILRERTESGLDPLSRFFGAGGIARIHDGILYHDRHTVDLSQSRAITLDSAIHLADNTHAFESKLPELLYGYPDSIIAMRLLKAAGELNDPQLMEEIKQKLIDDIQKNKNLAPDDKISLIKAVGTLTPKSYAFTAGRIMGNDPQLSYENGKVVVSVTESEIHQDVVSLFDQQSYAQLAKFLEDILKTNNKGVFLEQINGNAKRFEGDTVVIQALIGKDLKDKTKTDFQEKLTDLTGNNPNFTDYLNQDDNQKDLMNALITKIQAKKNPPKSLPKILKTRDFKTLIITLKSGEVRVFTDVMGTLTFARYEDGESTPTDYDYINTKDLSKYLPENDEIRAVRRDGEELPQGSYTVKETKIDQAEINELESNLADMRAARATLIREYLNPGSSKSEPELKTINDNSSIKLKKVEINGKFILVPEVESIQNMVQFIDKIIGANYENGQRLAGCRKNLCVAAAQIATVVSKASTNWSAEVYEIRDLNTFRNIGERDTFSGHAVVIMTEKNTSEKYIVDLTFSQFINPENNTISFHNLYGENSSNIPFLQKAIDMRIANGEKVNINTGIDYTKNNTATQLFEHGYLPFSEISNYLNLTVEQSSVNSAEDHRDKGFWARNISSLEPDSIYIDEENNAIDQVNKYTESLPEQTSSNQKLIQPISHKILNDTLEVIKTDEGYIVKPTGKSPVKTLETSWFGQPEPIHEDGLSLNDTFTSLKVIVDGQIYDMSFEDGIATITNSVSGQSTLLTDHVTKGKSWFMKLGNSFENFGLKLGSIFNPNYLVQMNLDMMIYGAQTDTYIGTSPLDVKDIPKAILRERIKNVGESDLHLATRKYVADYMFHTDDPDVLALDEVIRTADLLYNYLELDTYLGPLVQTNEEQLIGSPVINWSLTDNHTINLSNVHTDDNISLVDHLKSGHIITIEEPTKTTTISWDGNNYVIKRDFKNGSPIKENKTGNIARVESDYLPRAEDFNTKTYQIYIVNAGGANLHSSPLFDLLVASTPTMTFTDYRTPWQQFLDRFFGRTIGIVNFSIFGLKQPLPNQSFILFPEESVEINPDSNPDAKTSIETFTIDAKKSEIKDGFNLKRSQLAIIFNDVGSLFTSEGPISGTHINAYETSMIIERMLADLGLSEQTDSIYELDTNHIIGKEITLQFERYGKYYRTKVDYPERVEDEKIVNAYYAQSNHGDKRWHIGNVGYSSDGEVRSSGFTKTFDIGYGAKIKIGAAVVQNRDGKIITTNQVVSVIPPKELNTNIASLTVYSKTVDGKEKVDIEVVPRDWSKPYPTFKEVSPSDVKDYAMLEIKKNLALTPFYPKNGIATGLREVISSDGTVYSLKNEIGVSKDYTLYLSALPDGKKVIVKISNNNQKSFDTTIGENSYLTTLAKVLKENKLDTRGSVESYGLVLDKSGQPVGYAMEYLPTVAPQVLTASDIQTVKPTLDLFAGIGKRIDGPIGVITRADGTPAFAPLPGNRIIDVRPGLYIPGLQSGGIQ